ncbi:hypothetical protein, partial [Xanthomonas albilineans]|uniref:hypothetical protein n=1 Tax=Xanthomonas albilineans TaxID=29447 RepID=UPI001E2986D0
NGLVMTPSSQELEPPGIPGRFSVWWLFVFGIVLTACLAMAWRIPILLWDNIDLVPIYQAWEDGHLARSDFWKVHDGSHLHTAAYAILLLTTRVSGGQTWLDCLVSVVLLSFSAAVLLRMVLREFGAWLHSGWGCVFVFLALYPGHLINLHWGWQVAVFVSLLGCIVPVYVLTDPRLAWKGDLLAVAVAVVGVLGFSTTLVAFPVALGLILLHRASSVAKRLLMCVPSAGYLGLCSRFGSAEPLQRSGEQIAGLAQ